MAGKFNEERWIQMNLGAYTYSREDARKNKMSSIDIPSGYRFVAKRAFYQNGRMKNLTLPISCAAVGESAFEGCNLGGLLALPEGLQLIQKRAFAENRRLRGVEIPGSVRRLGQDCFKDCSNLKSAIFSENCPIRILPQGIFDSCKDLTRLQLPPELRKIEDRAFYRCKMLETVVFPPNLYSIGREAFYNNAIADLQLPPHLKILDESAFFKCKNLIEVHIPDSVEHIGKWAFHGCNRLNVLEILHDPGYMGEWIINKSCTIRCRRGSRVDDYCREYGFTTEYIEPKERENGKN